LIPNTQRQPAEWSGINLEINPETERLVREEITSGHFGSVDELIVTSVHAWREKNLASSASPSEAKETDIAAAARRKAGDAIRELRMGVTLDRPKGNVASRIRYIGHKY